MLIPKEIEVIEHRIKWLKRERTAYQNYANDLTIEIDALEKILAEEKEKQEK